jgi:hypothetical protein
MNDGQRTARTTGRRGFNSYQTAMNDRPVFLVSKENTHLIAFLEEENFTWAKRHWVDIIDPETSKRRTTVRNCLKTENDEGDWVDERGCPVCNTANTPSVTCFFNVVDLDGNRNKVLVWETTPGPTNVILKRYRDRQKFGKSISDPDIYYAVSKEQNGAWVYSVDPVRESDFAVEWPSKQPLTSAERERLQGKVYDESYVTFDTYDELEEFVTIMA